MRDISPRKPCNETARADAAFTLWHDLDKDSSCVTVDPLIATFRGNEAHTAVKKSLADDQRTANSSPRKTIIRRCRQENFWAKRTAMIATWLLLSSCSSSGIHLSFLDPQGPVADIQRSHFLEVLAVLAIFVALPVFLLTPWFAWRYRYGAKSSTRYAPKWKSYRPLEIACWGGPVVIVAVLGVLFWNSTHALDPYKPLASSQPALRVQVIGYDWKW
ncbi:MAG: hypothetical protein ACREFY_16605, partial [Acetobacteraceae bacterium]